MILVVLFLLLAVPIGFIVGIVLLIKLPRPPEGSGRSDLDWWYFQGGWKIAKQEEELRRRIKEEELEQQRLQEEADEALHNEILHDLRLGQRMTAIKRYQEYYGCSFEDAKYEIYEIDYQTGYERIQESETPQ